MTRRRRTGIVPVLLLLTYLSCPLGLSAGDLKPLSPSPRDKCPVCGMFVKKYPDWMSQIIFKNGSYAVFDGAKDMFKYYHNLPRYAPGRGHGDIGSIYVTDYYSLEPTDAHKAYYVTGSDVYGPMGRELIPFKSQADAREFLVDHKGKTIIRFMEVTQELLKGLDH